MKVCISCDSKFSGLSWICPNCHQSTSMMDGFLAFAPALAQESEGFESSYFAQLAPLESNNFWFRARNSLILWALQKYFPKARKFMEIGCGTGFVLSGIEKECSQLKLYGSEIFTRGLNFAAERLSNQVSLFQMDARQIPFSQEFDCIGAFDVLEHIEEDQVVLDQMYQATTLHGGIVLTVPQHPWLWSQADDFAHHVRRYRSQELKLKIEKAGFEIVSMTSFVSFLLPLMLVSRLRQRQPNAHYDALAELKIKGTLNQILEQIMTWEHSFIRWGCSLPWGGSLLVVAKKKSVHT